MKNKEIEALFESLPEELQEKAKACKTAEELLKLADENDIELPQEALESVSGGAICEPEICPKCGSSNVTSKTKKAGGESIPFYVCNDCGHTF